MDTAVSFFADVRVPSLTCFQPPKHPPNVYLPLPQVLSLFIALYHWCAVPLPVECSVLIPVLLVSQSPSMAFFSTQKEHKIKRTRSTERIKSNPTGFAASIPPFATSLPSLRTRSSSRPTTIYDAHPADVRLQGPDQKPPIPKSKPTSFSTRSVRRIPVPSLSIQDPGQVPYDCPRTSPIPSSRSTSVSLKSSIVDIGGTANATTPKFRPDHLKSSPNTRTPTPPYSSPDHWEPSSGSPRKPGGEYDIKKTPSPVFDLSVRVSSPQKVAIPMPSPKPASQKPQRAVLRRKSNAKQPLKPQPSIPSLNHRKSKPDLGTSPVTVTPQRTISTHQSPHLVPTPMSLDAAHSVRRSTSGERRPRNPENLLPPLSPQMLTPAGAVAAAYKEQEKRRDLRESVGTNADNLSHRDSCDEGGGAYYTVFGSSGKVVAVGAPEDESWSRFDNYTPNRPKSISRRPSLGALGRLSRKSSTKTKKGDTGGGGEGGIISESECGHERITRDDEGGRPSLQGRRSMSLPSKQRSKKPLGILIDNSDARVARDSPQSTSTPSKSAGWFTDDPPPSAGGKIWKLMKRLSTGGLRDKYSTQEATPPVPALPKELLPVPSTKPKLKIHSAPQSPDNSHPTTPRFIRGRSSFGDAPFTNRHRNAQGVSSPVSPHRPPTLGGGKNPSYRRRSTNTRCSSPVSSDKASSKYWQKSRSSSVSTFEEMPPLPRRVVTSGPILSPLELNKLEKEQAVAELSSPPSTADSHSPAASSSNHHGNTVAVIRKPSLRSMHVRASGDDSETDGMSTSDFIALPSPPRHRYRSNPHIVYHQSNDSGPNVGSICTSPTIPMFLTQDVVNQFHSARGSGVDVGMSRSLNSSFASQSTGISSNEPGVVIPVQPPPRPQRSDKRKLLSTNQHVTTRVPQDRERNGQDRHHGRGMLPSTSLPHPKERMLSASPESGGDEDGRSCGTFGSSQSKGLVELVNTSQDSNSPRENLRSSSSVHSRSPLRFREMGSGEGGKDRRVLTEKEKADKWDDLLEMSDRAGGTIRVGNTQLLSDSLRFSDYSTLTTSAL